MKKSTLLTIVGAVFAIAIYWLGFVIGAYYTENKTDKAESVLTDEELMTRMIADEYGDEYYGVLEEDDGDEYIEFLVLRVDDNTPKAAVSVTRNWCVTYH